MWKRTNVCKGAKIVPPPRRTTSEIVTLEQEMSFCVLPCLRWRKQTRKKKNGKKNKNAKKAQVEIILGGVGKKVDVAKKVFFWKVEKH